jgi:hypothetical protein
VVPGGGSLHGGEDGERCTDGQKGPAGLFERPKDAPEKCLQRTNGLVQGQGLQGENAERGDPPSPKESPVSDHEKKEKNVPLAINQKKKIHKKNNKFVKKDKEEYSESLIKNKEDVKKKEREEKKEIKTRNLQIIYTQRSTKKNLNEKGLDKDGTRDPRENKNKEEEKNVRCVKQRRILKRKVADDFLDGSNTGDLHGGNVTYPPLQT